METAVSAFVVLQSGLACQPIFWQNTGCWVPQGKN